MIAVSSLTLFLLITSVLSVVFTVYLYFRNPQIKTDQITLRLQDDITGLQKQVLEIKETHLRSVESDIKSLTSAVNELGKTVIKLSTIIDERIPRANPNLTPPGI